jgi:hypothetical protein
MNKNLETVLNEMKEHIIRCVAEGYDSPAEISQGAVDVFSDEAAVADLEGPARAYTAEAIAAHQEDELKWPQQTDCDRLDAAFNHLEFIGIIARQDFSCCGTCALGEILDEIEEARKRNLPARGYTFFHMQDTEAAVEGHGLCLNYGNAEQTENEAVAIGYEIVAILKEHGFRPVWDGSWSKRIFFPLIWKRRYKHC